MKKFLVLLFLMAIGTSVYAHKIYVQVYGCPYNGTNYQTIALNGAVPSDMQDRYYTNDKRFGDVLNMLAERGFVVEQMSSYGTEAELVILSKDSTTPSQTISKGDVNTDGEVNIADVNEVISLILGIVREHPEILEQIKKQTNN